MDGNWSLKLFKTLSCFSCNSQFCIKGFSLKGSKSPWLLQCGHSLCDSCIKQYLKISNTVTCPQCQTSYSVDSKSISEQFSFNLYIIGILTVFQIEKQEKDRKLAMLTTGDANFSYSVKGKQFNSDINNKSVLCEECSLIAYWSCENCQCHFCDPCWSKVHGAAKSLMKHVKLPTTLVESSKTEFGKCPNHEMQDLDLFCKSCRKSVCSYCVIQSHQGGQHCLITMKEQNSEMVNLLKTVAEEAELICKRMKHTLQKIKLTQSSPETADDQSWSNVKNQILQNFARLHGILQLQEEKFLKQLYNKSNERENMLRDICVQLETQIQKAEFLLEKYEHFVKKPQPCDLNILYDQLSEVKSLPCYLISQKCGTTELKVSFNDSLVRMLENYCSIELPSNEIFELRSGTDLPEDFAVEPLPVSNYDQRGSVPTIFGSNSDVDTVSNCSSRDLCDGSDLFKLNPTKKPNVFCEGRKYSVHITYINNPGEFYVTLNSQRKIKENVEKRAASYGYPFIISSTICKDDLYLVKYKIDGKWYRGRVVEVLPESSGSQTRAVIHYIDYGNTDTVPVSWMKPLSPDLTEEPPLAIKCKLFNCVPKNGKWSKDSVKTMEKIVSGLTATLFVMKIHPDCLEVDLSVIYPEGQIGRDIVSVRDALIFLECASFVGGTKIPENPSAVKYEEQSLPSIGESFDVVITHVNSPDDFYLHRTKQDGLFLCKLESELQNYYNENSQKGVIYNPQVGMPCAAKFSVDKKWYRAVIDDLPGKKMVSVYYVDYGNKEKIPWTDIRKLRENFVKRPPLAIRCSMAKIQPKVPGSWNPQAKAYLGKCILTKGISVQVEGRHASEPKLKVLIYEQLKGQEVCVNFLFVDMGFTSTLVSSGSERLPESCAEGVPGAQKEDQEKQENFTKDARHEKLRKYKLSAKELRQNYESEKRQFGESTATDDSDGSETCTFKDSRINVKVEVLSAESPYCIYVTFPKGNEDLKILQSKLNEFYENTTPLEDKEWTVDNKCAVYYSENKCWCRASISKVIGDGTVKVFLKDFAATVTAPVSSLRELDPLFTKYGPRAIKCHLANVAPPGDTWPGISCEYLAGELEACTEVYMSKKGEIENNSLPVELWVQKLIPASALEPINVEWTTLNKLLVEKGLAVPKDNLWYLTVSAEESAPSSEKESGSICERSEEPTKEPTTVLPSLGSKWPPPVPLKKSRFTAIPTYVDLEGLIYVQDIEDQEGLLEIRDSLREEYGNSKPSAEDHFWNPGQMCIARYFADNEWYRGIILETSDNGKYQVLFVDYGNVELCQVADLRKRVKMTEVPILVHKIKLYGVAPTTRNEKWPLVVIEVLHSLVVDKKCEVTILPSHNAKEPYLAVLNIIEDDQDVATVLIQEHLAKHQVINSESSESFNDLDCSSEREDSPNYNSEASSPNVIYVSLNIPEDCMGLHVLVKALRNENEFYGHLVDSEYLPLNLKNVLKQFQKLEETLSEECHLQPKLTNIVEGKACCSVHSGINKWCRGQIETVGDNCACIFYVDYGYKEFMSTDLVHECKPEWQKLPKMAVKFSIPNLVKCPNVSKAAYMKALTSCLMETQFYAEILGRQEDSLEVELLTEKGGVLSYKQMMDTQLIKTT